MWKRSLFRLIKLFIDLWFFRTMRNKSVLLSLFLINMISLLFVHLTNRVNNIAVGCIFLLLAFIFIIWCWTLWTIVTSSWVFIYCNILTCLLIGVTLLLRYFVILSNKFKTVYFILSIEILDKFVFSDWFVNVKYSCPDLIRNRLYWSNAFSLII